MIKRILWSNFDLLKKMNENYLTDCAIYNSDPGSYDDSPSTEELMGIENYSALKILGLKKNVVDIYQLQLVRKYDGKTENYEGNCYDFLPGYHYAIFYIDECDNFVTEQAKTIEGERKKITYFGVDNEEPGELFPLGNFCKVRGNLLFE